MVRLSSLNPAKCDALDYIQFLIAAQMVSSEMEAACCDPRPELERPAHNAYTHLLRRHPPDNGGLWAEVQGCINRQPRLLILGDSTLDKPYATSKTTKHHLKAQ